MLYNLDWLNEKQSFPPKSELKRLKGYIDNANLFDDEPSNVIEPYLKRFRQIVGKLKDNDNDLVFFDTKNYWQLSTIKTVDLMVGDRPNVICEKAKDKLEEVLQNTSFYNKLEELVIDNDSLGECILRPYINQKGERDFVSQSPSMWFPIVNPENIKEVVADCLCWTVCVYQDANNSLKNKYELNCKIQYRGSDKIEIRRYSVPKVEHYTDFTDKTTYEHFGKWDFFIIGNLIEQREEDAPFSQLVIHIPSTTTSRSLHGISNYDRITTIVAELAIREDLASFILDQNSAPRLAAPDGAFTRNADGNWVLKSGGRNFVVKQGEAPPVYITWDGNLQANENRIKDLKQELFSLCEMGTIINQDDINSSQGYEALQVKLTNAKLKVLRMSNKFTKELKTLICYLLGNNKLEDKDINIIFNNDIPVSEIQTIATAQAKKNLGVSTKSVLMEYFGYTEEQAEAEVEMAKEENASSFIENFGISRSGGFGSQENDGEPSNGIDDKSASGGGKEPINGKDEPKDGE